MKKLLAILLTLILALSVFSMALAEGKVGLSKKRW